MIASIIASWSRIFKLNKTLPKVRTPQILAILATSAKRLHHGQQMFLVPKQLKFLNYFLAWLNINSHWNFLRLRYFLCLFGWENEKIRMVKSFLNVFSNITKWMTLQHSFDLVSHRREVKILQSCQSISLIFTLRFRGMLFRNFEFVFISACSGNPNLSLVEVEASNFLNWTRENSHNH